MIVQCGYNVALTTEFRPLLPRRKSGLLPMPMLLLLRAARRGAEVPKLTPA
jgi:hypothetical protein